MYYINILWSNEKKKKRNGLQSKYLFKALNTFTQNIYWSTKAIQWTTGHKSVLLYLLGRQYSLMETNSLICSLMKRILLIESLISVFIILNSFVNCWDEFMSVRPVGVKLDALPYVFILVDATAKNICVLRVFFFKHL